MTALTLLLVAAATYRLTRLVTADRITEPLRAWVEARGPRVGYLITCDWCLSVWLAPIPSALALTFPGNRLVLGALAALTASAITGFASLIEQRIDR